MDAVIDFRIKLADDVAGNGKIIHRIPSFDGTIRRPTHAVFDLRLTSQGRIRAFQSVLLSDDKRRHRLHKAASLAAASNQAEAGIFHSPHNRQIFRDGKHLTRQ